MNKNIFLSLLVSLFSFLILDFTYSKVKNNKIANVIEYDDNFEYNLKKNISLKDKFGPFLIDICTNKIGMRISCKKSNKKKNYNLALIGDSFIEGVGLNYENTIGGIIESKTNLNIANLGVRSYSPVNYYKKIITLFEQGYDFDHIIIFIDISDIQDEYHRSGKIRKNAPKNVKNNLNNLYSMLTSNFQISYYLYFKIKSYLRNSKNSKEIDKIFLNYDAYSKDYERGSWTYNKKNKFRKKGLIYSHKNMRLLADFLNENDIEFSIAVYPWPQQLIFDNVESFHVNYWENFCKNYKCKNFINLFKDFFIQINNNNLNKVILNNYFFTDIHFNRNGNNVIAEKIINIYDKNNH